jgi:hypothetical protein
MDRPQLARLVLFAAGGGAPGGTLNALHALYLFQDNLAWHIVPAGLIHGALLAALSLFCARFIAAQRLALRLALPAVEGYIIGYATFLPIVLSAHFDLSFFWFGQEDQPFYWPWWAFGLVAALSCLGWGAARLIGSSRLAVHLATGSVAGVLGSLWWWSSWEESLTCLLHGTLWGCLVGLGVWKAGQSSPARR